MQQITIRITVARLLVFIFVLKCNEFNDRTPHLSRIIKANITFSFRCLTYFYDFVNAKIT